MKNDLAELTKLAWYLITVILCISIQGFTLLPIIYGLVTRTLPSRFIGKMGLALATAAVFIAQMTSMNPSLEQTFIISITATAASIGAASIPHAGLVTLVMVLEIVDLPSEAVSIIMSVNCLVDKFRTASKIPLVLLLSHILTLMN